MSKIILSEISILPIKPKNGLIAFVSFILNEQFYIGNIAVYSTLDGTDYRLVYPDKILPNGKRINCFHPICQEAGEIIKEAVIKKYRELLIKPECKKVDRNYGNKRFRQRINNT